jgi:hypothetical protein
MPAHPNHWLQVTPAVRNAQVDHAAPRCPVSLAKMRTSPQQRTVPPLSIFRRIIPIECQAHRVVSHPGNAGIGCDGSAIVARAWRAGASFCIRHPRAHHWLVPHTSPICPDPGLASHAATMRAREDGRCSCAITSLAQPICRDGSLSPLPLTHHETLPELLTCRDAVALHSLLRNLIHSEAAVLPNRGLAVNEMVSRMPATSVSRRGNGIHCAQLSGAMLRSGESVNGWRLVQYRQFLPVPCRHRRAMLLKAPGQPSPIQTKLMCQSGPTPF